MKLAYLCAPYRAKTIRGTVENIRVAESASIELWKRGYAVVCPHLNTALLDGLLPDKVWLKGDIKILSRCDLIVIATIPRYSEGMEAELDYARENGIPIRFLGNILDTEKEIF